MVPEGDPLVTVVVATYGRPDTLACALESVRRQDLERWEVLVVGDACPSAGAVVQGFADPRMRFVNLPVRQGEQSAPNSVGIALAQTPWIALLNHDDLWLHDHLRRAVRALRSDDVDLYAGAAAFAPAVIAVPGGDPRPVFAERTPPQRRLADAFSAGSYLFEPTSALVVDRSLADRVGPWRSATQIHRTPMTDWLLRLWRHGARLHQDAAVTTLKLNTHNVQASGLRYARNADDQRTLLSLMAATGTAGLRAVIQSDLRMAEKWGAPGARDVNTPFPGMPNAPVERLLDPAAAQRFLNTGEDVFDEIASDLGLVPGVTLRRALQRRTGETLMAPADLAALVADCRRQLEAV